MAKVTKDLEEKIGKDRLEEIVEKDWKVSDLPSEEELKSEKPKNPKARNNPNSRANLVQYRKRTKEEKKAALSNLKVEEIEEDVDPKDIFGDEYELSIIESIMPARSVLKGREEQVVYYNTVYLFLRDFNIEELSYSDLDDIITLALNKVLEQRLLKVAVKSEKMVLEASPALEKLRKHSDKIKSNLANRRVDRIDLKNKPTTSIVDLSAHLDQQNKLDFEARIKELTEERENYVPPQRDKDGLIVEEGE